MKNRDDFNIDKLFHDALSKHSEEAPLYVWDKVKSKRTLFYIFLNHIRVNGNRYLALAGSATAIITAAIVFWPENNLASHQTEIAENSMAEAEKQNTEIQSHKVEKEFQATATPEKAQTYQNTTKYQKTDEQKGSKNQRSNPIGLDKLDDKREEVYKSQTDPSDIPTDSPKSDGKILTDAINQAKKTEIPSEERDPILAQIEILEPPIPLPPAEQQTQNQQNKEEQKLLPEAQRNWEIELALGYGFGQRNLADKGKSNADEYITNRKQSEQIANVFNLNLLVNYRLPSHLKLSTGINVFAVTEKVNFDKAVYSTRTEERLVKGYILDPINGPTAYTYTVIDTIKQSSFETKNRNNQYVFVDIPVMLGHTVWQNNKWEMSLRGGVLFNLAFVQRGAILGGDGIDLAELGSLQAPMKNRADLSYTMAIQGVYRFNEKIALLFEPNYRLGSGNLFDSGFGIAQKFSSFNTNIGLRYRF